MKEITIIIPSLNPDEKLNRVVDGLLAEGFSDIVIVNDGSDEKHKKPFEEAAKHPEVVVLNHEVNKGKGRALKTAFTYIRENRPGIAGAVTVDGDGQHLPKDISACAATMIRTGAVVFGCRNFREAHVPKKSRFGNLLTSFVLRAFCGIKLSDTQTGLRAFPYCFLEQMEKVKGERFEYETEMIFVLKKEKIPFVEQTITTVYLEDNKSTHFDPFRDSIQIYSIIFRYLFSSGASALIDYVIYSVMLFLLENHLGRGAKLFCAFLVARVFSSLFNYTMNRKTVFGSETPVKQTITRYYCLCVIQTAVSYGLVWLLSYLFDAGSVLEILLKAVVETIIFFVSFRIQHNWVFRDR